MNVKPQLSEFTKKNSRHWWLIPAWPIHLMMSLSLLVGLTACDFHLRGSTALTWSKIYLQSEAADRITQEVQRVLQEENVEIVPTAQTAQLVLRLSEETSDRRVLSVSAVSGKMQEIELNYRVTMTVQQSDNKILLAPQVISLSKDYTFDETAVLAMSEEENTLREELLQDMVAQVVRRLQSIKITP